MEGEGSGGKMEGGRKEMAMTIDRGGLAISKCRSTGRPAQQTANWSFSSHSLILIEW